MVISQQSFLQGAILRQSSAFCNDATCCLVAVVTCCCGSSGKHFQAAPKSTSGIKSAEMLACLIACQVESDSHYSGIF